MSTIYCLNRSQHYVGIGLGTHNETFYDTMQYISASADRTIHYVGIGLGTHNETFYDTMQYISASADRNITSASVSAHIKKHSTTRCNIF